MGCAATIPKPVSSVEWVSVTERGRKNTKDACLHQAVLSLGGSVGRVRYAISQLRRSPKNEPKHLLVIAPPFKLWIFPSFIMKSYRLTEKIKEFTLWHRVTAPWILRLELTLE